MPCKDEARLAGDERAGAEGLELGVLVRAHGRHARHDVGRAPGGNLEVLVLQVVARVAVGGEGELFLVGNGKLIEHVYLPIIIAVLWCLW